MHVDVTNLGSPREITIKIKGWQAMRNRNGAACLYCSTVTQIFPGPATILMRQAARRRKGPKCFEAIPNGHFGQEYSVGLSITLRSNSQSPSRARLQKIQKTRVNYRLPTWVSYGFFVFLCDLSESSLIPTRRISWHAGIAVSAEKRKQQKHGGLEGPQRQSGFQGTKHRNAYSKA